jgi:hypothetical protein
MIQTFCEAHPASCLLGSGCLFCGDNVGIALSWPLNLHMWIRSKN